MGTVKYSGPIASFHCPTNAEIRSLKVHFSPKQAGSGNPSPENVRPITGWTGLNVWHTGKNLLDTSKKYQQSSTQVVIGQDSKRKNYKTFLKAGTYTVTINATTTLTIYVGKKSIDDSVYVAGNPATFTLTDDDWIEIFAYKSAGISASEIISFTLELGSTATSYESYQGSTTAYEFGVLGKNKYDYNSRDIFEEAAKDDNGKGVTASTNSYDKHFTSVKPNTIYTISGIVTGSGYKRIYFYTENKEWISRSAYFTAASQTFTTPANCYFIQIQSGYTEVWSGIQLELGSTATAYEPYDPKHTVYGGWVDLITGEVQEEYKLLDKPWSEWGNKTVFEDGTELRYINFGTPVKGNGISNFKTSLCNVAKYLYGNENGTTHYYIVGNSYNCRVYLPTGTNENTQIQVLGELVTPITCHLAPTELQTFLGQNNIWSNADYVEVEYDLHETQTILARKQFIIANQPHIVKPAAAPLQSFTTDMAAPLKECRVYFNPVQEGSGDPSPDNVRPITGWTGMDVYRTGKNLFDKDAVTDKFWIRAGNLSEENPLGTIRGNASGYTLSQYIPVHPNTIYTIKYNVASQATAAGMVFFSEQNANSAINGISLYDQTYINSSTTREYYTFTTPINCHYIRVSTPPKSSNVQLELGSTATDYESYQGTTLSIDWTDSTGIVYGGYVDLITGKIWQTHRQAPIVRNENDPYWNSWGTSLMYNATTMGSTNGKRKVGTIVLSDTLTPIGGTVNPQNVTTLDEIRYYGVHASYPQYLFMANPDGLSSTEWRKWLYDTYPNANICYELETPILLTTLTPTQLKSLRGTNNIWSSAGDVSVSYWKH